MLSQLLDYYMSAARKMWYFILLIQALLFYSATSRYLWPVRKTTCIQWNARFSYFGWCCFVSYIYIILNEKQKISRNKLPTIVGITQLQFSLVLTQLSNEGFPYSKGLIYNGVKSANILLGKLLGSTWSSSMTPLAATLITSQLSLVELQLCADIITQRRDPLGKRYFQSRAQ